MFYDSEGTSIDALSLIGKYCFAKCAIKIESIFIGNKICLQVKLYECEVKPMDSGVKRLLKRPTSQPEVLKSNNIKPMDFESKNDDDAGSVHDSDDENENKSKPKNKSKTEVIEDDKTQKRVVKRVVKKVVRKDE